MSMLSRKQARLANVQSLMADIEAIHPTIVRYKSYSEGFGEIAVSYQEYGDVWPAYKHLLLQEERLEEEIAELTDYENENSAVAAFSR